MIYRVKGPSRCGKTSFLKKISSKGFFVPFPPDEIFITSSVEEELKFEGLSPDEYPEIENKEIPPTMLPHTLKELLAIAVSVEFCKRKKANVLAIDEPFTLFSDKEYDKKIVKKMCNLLLKISEKTDIYYSHREHLNDPAEKLLAPEDVNC